MEYSAHDLVYNYTEEQMWNLPIGNYLVRFDDGEVTMTNKQLYLSWFYWELYRCFPGARLIKDGAINEFYTSSAHRKLGGLLIWHIFREHELTARYSVHDLTKVFYEIGNVLYNISCTRFSSYVTSVSLYDLVEIFEAPEIVQAKENYNLVCIDSNYNEHLVSEEIKKIYNSVSSVLYKNANYLSHNGIKKLCIEGLVNTGQMLQLIGPRGYVKDIDGIVFPYPIDVGYGEGLTTIYDSITESRSASYANIMTTDPLQQSEWFNRKVQLATTIIMDYDDMGECGCNGYVTIPFLVEPEDYILLKGKYHMVDNLPVLIWDTIDDIVGTVIELRTITGCGHHNVQRVCSICLGWSIHVIPPNTNLGFALATPLCGQISQTIMGTKHLVGSSASMKLDLDSSSSRWVREHPKHPGKLFLTDYALDGNLLLRIDSAYVRNLSQITHIDIAELPATRVTKIPEFGITHTDKSGDLLGPFDKLTLAVSGVGVHLTTEVLKYLKEHGWGSGKGYIEFNLKNWNPNTPVFLIPRKGDDIMTFFNDVKTFIEPEKKTTTKITSCNTRGEAVGGLINILRRRLNKANKQEFNIIQVEIFIRAMMMVDFNTGRFELPHPSQDFHFMGLKQVNRNRSLTSMLAYQDQYSALCNINWQVNPQLTEHLLDPILST